MVFQIGRKGGQVREGKGYQMREHIKLYMSKMAT